MSIRAAANSTLGIRAVPLDPGQTLDRSTYEGFDYVYVDHIENLGQFGSEAARIEGKFLDSRYVRKLKGSRDNGDLEMVCAFDANSPGQIAIKAAEATDHRYAFEVKLNDAPPGGTPTTFYFAALVMSARVEASGTDDIVKLNATIAIDGEIIEVPAASAAPSVTLSPPAGALPGATEGDAYSTTITASGGTGTVSYAVTSGALPDGLTLNAATGEISGTPTTAGTANFTVTATYDGSGTASAAYSIAVS